MSASSGEVRKEGLPRATDEGKYPRAAKQAIKKGIKEELLDYELTIQQISSAVHVITLEQQICITSKTHFYGTGTKHIVVS